MSLVTKANCHRFIHSLSQIGRTLWVIIREHERGNRSYKEWDERRDRRTWRRFKDRLRVQHAGTTGGGSLEVPASDIPFQKSGSFSRHTRKRNHQKGLRSDKFSQNCHKLAGENYCGRDDQRRKFFAEMDMLQVNRRLLEELESMGFLEARAIEALRHSGNANVEAAIEWLISHGNDSDIDQMMPGDSMDLEVGSPGPDFITEEMKMKVRELRDRAAKKRNGERILDSHRNTEKDRIQASKGLAEARRVAEENERARYVVARKAEKEEERQARERILQKLENDKRERRRNPWSTLEDSPGARQPPLPPVVDKKKNSPVGYSSSKANAMRECLRSLKRNPEGDDGRAARAFQTLLKIIGNILMYPDDEKFRTIRLANPVFQDRVGHFEEGVEFLLLCGFEITEEGKFLHLPRDRVDVGLLNLTGLQLKSALTNPFFGRLERQI